VGDATALILKVHRSNYQIVGFTEEFPWRNSSPLAMGGEFRDV